MANIATCPKCARQLGLPPALASADRVECPECHAAFSLGDTVQISLPVARLLDPTEHYAAAGGSIAGDSPGEAQAALVDSIADATIEGTAPVRSWEERLREALARDGSAREAASHPLAAGSEVSEVSPAPDESRIADAAASSPPNFEFELDPTTPTDLDKDRRRLKASLPASYLDESPTAEPDVEPTNMRSKTLADFAAVADIPAQEMNPSSAPPPAAKNVANTATSTTESTIADDLPNEVSNGVVRPEAVEDVATEPSEMIEQWVPQRRAEGRGVAKVAAFAIGPVAGCLLGLYGLLWLQGAKADYVGLSRVLPAALLPSGLSAELTEAGADSVLAKSSALEENLNAAAAASLQAARQLPAKSQQELEAIRRDEAVIPASAARSEAAEVNAVAPADRSKVDQFNKLVDAAAAALPDFVAGDLSTDESIKRKGQAYVVLCRLAEHFDFAQHPGLAPAMQAKARQAAQLYLQATRQANYRQDLSHIAARWWEYRQRPSRGIFLAGHVGQTVSVESGTLCWVKLGRQATVPEIPVLFKHQGYQTGEQIGVVGSVISSPSDLPAGFSGPQIVKADYDFQLLTAQ